MLVQRVLWDLSKHPNAFRHDNGILKFRDSWSEAAQTRSRRSSYQPTPIANPSRKYRHIQFPMADEAEPRKKMDSFLICEFSKIHMVRRKSISMYVLCPNVHAGKILVQRPHRRDWCVCGTMRIFHLIPFSLLV